MGIDAVALLRIRDLAQSDELGVTVVYSGTDCVGVFVPERFQGITSKPDMAALAISTFCGSLIEQHDDPRGVLLFPDVVEPKGESYAAVVEEMTGVGVWVAMPT